jgi:hypothetical protein
MAASTSTRVVAAMTERPVKRRRGLSASTVIFGSLAAFLVVLAFLTFQLRAGKDPALSHSAVAQVQQQQPRQVVVRKVEDDYVITKVIPAQSGSVGTQPALTTGSSGSSSSSSAPVVTSSPAPVAAPVAAAPAPVTRTS